MRVLIVDNSIVFRSQIKAALMDIPSIEVVGSVSNGKIALAKIEQETIDLITLDLEMPELGGLETLQELRRRGYKTRVIVFASPNNQEVDSALQSIHLGADDVVLKPSGSTQSLESAAESIKAVLLPKILQFVAKEVVEEKTVPLKTTKQKSEWPLVDLDRWGPPEVVVIGSSTGGPVALEQLLQGVQSPFPCPILIVQHMPPVFTTSWAERLSKTTGLNVREATPMEPPLANHCYVAPGDYHMYLIKKNEGLKLMIEQGPRRNSVRPSVDILFESAAEVYGNRALGIILTGMGEDGLLGAQSIKKLGGAIMIQNKESSIVFGMPGAVFDSGAYDKIGHIKELSFWLKKIISPVPQ
ncbi:MAG: chemotaxis-specific protein-glutamate methyltransferase CheB [Oligoflexia bacterium]|nr:chemotaxis-specific protein-glutamate methyltransferase CheB [Oligoflexia bacterium]